MSSPLERKRGRESIRTTNVSVIPRAKTKLTRVGNAQSDSSDQQQISERRRHKSTVLIVDDQSTGRQILEQLVRSIDQDLSVESFEDPYLALERAAQQTPDLILTDYKMPIMDGVTFTRRLRTIPGCADVPLVVVTIVNDPEVRYQALDAGATDFLTRPIDQHECRARCKNLLTLRKQQQIIKNRAKWLEVQVAMATKQIRKREQETILRLAKAGEYRDEGTCNHILRMAKFSRIIADELGLPESECEEIELAASMHDIGKIGIPDHILLKRGRLTDEEWETMKAHTSIGYDILKDSPSRYIQQGAVVALGHHEKYDGTGYPKGLKGEEIPLIARIVAVADVFDALTSQRPYKQAWEIDHAVEHLKRLAGKDFDPNCVDALLLRLEQALEIREELKDEPETDSTNSSQDR